jgi:hypothetical protein
VFFRSEAGIALGEVAGVRGNLEARRGKRIDTA